MNGMGWISDDRFILERFKKEVIHELGHTFGLIHCHIPTCVMRSSTYVEDIDQKSTNLCIKCRSEFSQLNHLKDLIIIILNHPGILI